MCKAYDSTREIVKDFSKKKSFKKRELYNSIRKKGGVLRLRAGYSVKDYLEDLEYNGLFKYYPKSEEYIKISS